MVVEMYCPKCGTQNLDDAAFCSKCGNELSKLRLPETEKPFTTSQSSKEKPAKVISIGLISSWLFGGLFLIAGIGWLFQAVAVGIPLILISIAIFPPITKRVKDKFNFELSTPLKIVITIILLAIASANIPDTSNKTDVKLGDSIGSDYPVKTTVLITTSPSQMLPTINDMPDGAKKLDESGNDTYAQKKFAIITVFTAQTIIYEIRKFPSINEAIDDYNSIKNKYSDYKLSNVNLGDESFGLVVGNSIATVAFRKANAVVKVEFVGQYTSNLDDTISYAKMVKTPTSTLKLVVDTKTLTKGETWNMGDGYALKVMNIDQKATPKQVWLELDRNDNKLDDKVLSSGQTYNYNNIFSTKIDSISDTEIVLRNTYVAS